MEKGKSKMKVKNFQITRRFSDSFEIIEVEENNNQIRIGMYLLEKNDFDEIVKFIINKYQCESCGRYVNNRKKICAHYGSSLIVCDLCFNSLIELKWRAL